MGKNEHYQKQQASMQEKEGLEPPETQEREGKKAKVYPLTHSLKCMSLYSAINLSVPLGYYTFYMNTPINYVIKI